MPRPGVKSGNLKLLSDKQVKIIHDSSMRVLEKTGLRVLNQEALEIYEKNSCKVDFDKKIVKISEDVLMEFLAKAPSEFTLYGKSEDYDLKMNCDTTYLNGGAAAVKVLDFDGKVRTTTKDDLDKFTRLQDAMDETDMICPLIIPYDVEPEILELYMSSQALTKTNKNCYLWVHSGMEVEYQMKMVEVITGKKFNERPCFNLCIDLISPLVQPEKVLDTMITAVKNDVPVFIEVCDMMGSTSPITLAGTLVQQSVNILPGIALAQMIKPGASCLYSIASAASDMRSGVYLAADPVSMMLNQATAQIGHYYNLPVNNGTSLDSKLPDVQAGYERAFQNMGAVAAGTNVLHLGTGLLEQMAMANFEMVVIDNEIFGMCKKFFEEIKMDEGRLAEDAIAEVMAQPGGEYLSRDHTLNYFKDNLWDNKITDKKSYEVWKKDGRVSARDKAKEIAKNIIENHYPEVVNKDQEKQIDEILEEAMAKLKEVKKETGKVI